MAFCVFPTLFECFAPGEGIELYLLLSALIREWYERSPHPAQDKLNVKIVYSLWSLKPRDYESLVKTHRRHKQYKGRGSNSRLRCEWVNSLRPQYDQHLNFFPKILLHCYEKRFRQSTKWLPIGKCFFLKIIISPYSLERFREQAVSAIRFRRFPCILVGLLYLRAC